MRKFRIVPHLDESVRDHFTVYGGLKVRREARSFRSLRAAEQAAAQWAAGGWRVAIVRRIPGGWALA